MFPKRKALTLIRPNLTTTTQKHLDHARLFRQRFVLIGRLSLFSSFFLILTVGSWVGHYVLLINRKVEVANKLYAVLYCSRKMLVIMDVWIADLGHHEICFHVQNVISITSPVIESLFEALVLMELSHLSATLTEHFPPFLETFVAAQTLVECSGATQNSSPSGTCTQTPSCQQPVASRGFDPGRGRRTHREPREALAQGQAQTL